MKLSWTAIGGKLGGLWERERRDTLFLLGAIFLTVSPHLSHLPLWASGFFLLLFAWRIALVWSGRALPGRTLQLVFAVACSAGVYLQYKTLFGRDPGVCLLVLFLGLKLMEIRARRDLFVVLFLCLFLLITSFFYSQGFGTIVLVALAVLALIAAMITIHYTVKEASVPKRIRLGLVILLQALPIAAVMFLLFPRFQNPLWAMPDDKGTGRTGLSSSMAPGSVGNLLESSEIVMRVQFAGTPPNKKDLYWRGPVFGSFDGRTWRAPTYLVVAPPRPEIRAVDQNPLRYTVTMEPQDNDWVLALDVVTKAPVVNGQATQVSPELLLSLPNSTGGRIRYEAESVSQYTLGENENRLQQQNWLDLPPSFNPRTLDLAARWAAETPDKTALVERALAYIQQEPFWYTLNPPLLGRNSVDDFLFTSRRGFCEHYSNAFVVLMRALDIPARVVTGYQGGERNPVDGIVTVRSSDAHAWAEVWLQGRGWVRVDPTAAVAPERIEKTARLARDLGADTDPRSLGWKEQLRYRWEAVSHGWNQWVLNYDQKKQRELLASLGLGGQDWRQLLGTMAIFLSLALGLIAAITLRPRKPKHPLEQTFSLLTKRLTSLGIEVVPADTALRLASKAKPHLSTGQHNALMGVVNRYNALRYKEVNPSRSDVRSLNQAISRLPLAN